MAGKSRGVTEAVAASGAATDWEVVSQREMGSWRAWAFPESGGSHWNRTLSCQVMGPNLCFKRTNQAPGWRMAHRQEDQGRSRKARWVQLASSS